MIPFDYAKQINYLINSTTKYKSDPELYSKNEFWEIANGAGDCEDFALAKRKIFLNKGYSPSDLALITCWTESKEYHAVLMVKTDVGEYVLDNRHDYPMAKENLPYIWHKIQVGKNGMKFHSIFNRIYVVLLCVSYCLTGCLSSPLPEYKIVKTPIEDSVFILPPASESFVIGKETDPPKGWVSFCERYQSDPNCE